MKITKEMLSKENSKLAQEVNELRRRLDYLQKEFSQVFAGYPQQPLWAMGRNNTTMSWEEIFFRIGELNSDANYSIILEEKFRLQNELQQLKDKINKDNQ